MALDCRGGYKEKLVSACTCVLHYFVFMLVHSALVLDSYAHDQNKVEPYSIQAVKDIEAFLQIVLRSPSFLIHTRYVQSCAS